MKFALVFLLAVIPVNVQGQTTPQHRETPTECLTRARRINHVLPTDQLAQVYCNNIAVDGNPDERRENAALNRELAAHNPECSAPASWGTPRCRSKVQEVRHRLQLRRQAEVTAGRRQGCNGRKPLNDRGEACCDYLWHREVSMNLSPTTPGTMRTTIHGSICTALKAWRPSCTYNPISSYNSKYRANLLACTCSGQAEPVQYGGRLDRGQCVDYRPADARLDEVQAHHHRTQPRHEGSSASSSAKSGAADFPFGAPTGPGAGAE